MHDTSNNNQLNQPAQPEQQTETVTHYRLSKDFSYKLSKYLLKGDLIRKNTIWGLRILKRSALQENNPESQFHLGVIHFEGRKVKQDKVFAFNLFKKAAKNFEPIPDNPNKQKEIFGYLTRIAFFFIEELNGDSVKIVDFFCKFKNAVNKAFHPAFTATIQYSLEASQPANLLLIINGNKIYKQSINNIQQAQVQTIIEQATRVKISELTNSNIPDHE